MTEQNDTSEHEIPVSDDKDPNEVKSSPSNNQDEETDVVTEEKQVESLESDVGNDSVAETKANPQSNENKNVSTVEQSVSLDADGNPTSDDEISAVTFPQLEVSAVERQDHPELLNNVHVDLSVELGRKEMTVEEVSTMKVHDVIELSKLAGEAFEIRINGRIFAVGDVVIIGQNRAVRLTSMINHGNEIK